MSTDEKLVLTFSEASGLTKIYRKMLGPNTSILMYHGVVKEEWRTTNQNWLQVRSKDFEAQMKYLSQYYEVISMDEALRTLDQKSRKPKAVITFDDGYRNNYTVAYPILKRLNLPATIFLVSGMIGTVKLFWYDRVRMALLDKVEYPSSIETLIESYKTLHPREIEVKVSELISERGIQMDDKDLEAYTLLSIPEIHEMQNSGLISFDSHTHNHEILSRLTDQEVKETLETSLEVLRSYGIDCGKVFCYPNGRYLSHHPDILKSLGFQMAVTTHPGSWVPKSPVFEIPRHGIGQHYDIQRFRNAISGYAALLANVKRTVLRKKCEY